MEEMSMGKEHVTASPKNVCTGDSFDQFFRRIYVQINMSCVPKKNIGTTIQTVVLIMDLKQAT